MVGHRQGVRRAISQALALQTLRLHSIQRQYTTLAPQGYLQGGNRRQESWWAARVALRPKRPLLGLAHTAAAPREIALRPQCQQGYLEFRRPGIASACQHSSACSQTHQRVALHFPAAYNCSDRESVPQAAYYTLPVRGL